MKRSGPPSAAGMVDRHAQQSARRALDLDELVAEPGDGRFDGGMLAHGGSWRCLRLRRTLRYANVNKGSKKRSAKKMGRKNRPLDAFWERAELYPLPRLAASHPTVKAAGSASGHMPESVRPPRFERSPWDFSPASASSSPASCPAVRSPTASPAPVAARAPSWPSATRASASASGSASSPPSSAPTLVFDCDVADDAQIDALFAALGEAWPSFDGFVHSIGYAPKEAIAGDFLEGLSREAFKIAHDISSYSFPALAKAAACRASTPGGGPPHPDLSGGAAQRSQLQHDGAGQGVARGQRCATWRRASARAAFRVNGISAGPIKTLAAAGIKGFGKILDVVAENRAAAPQRDDRRRRQRRRLPALGPGQRRDVGDHLRRRRLQPRHGAGAEAGPTRLGPQEACPRRRTQRSRVGSLTTVDEVFAVVDADALAARPSTSGRGRRCRSRGRPC